MMDRLSPKPERYETTIQTPEGKATLTLTVDAAIQCIKEIEQGGRTEHHTALTRYTFLDGIGNLDQHRTYLSQGDLDEQKKELKSIFGEDFEKVLAFWDSRRPYKKTDNEIPFYDRVKTD